jgi:CyaY protein
MSIEQNTFDALAERVLGALDRALGDIDGVDADFESGVLTIEFGDGECFVINSHRGARQIWMAAGANAWHFDADVQGQKWTATKTGEDLWTCIGRTVGEKLGRPITLEARRQGAGWSGGEPRRSG